MKKTFDIGKSLAKLLEVMAKETKEKGYIPDLLIAEALLDILDTVEINDENGSEKARRINKNINIVAMGLMRRIWDYFDSLEHCNRRIEE